MIATESKQVVSRKQYFGRLRLTPRVPTSGHLVAPCFPTDPTSLELSEKCSKPRSGPPPPGALHASPCDASRRSLRGDPPADQRNRHLHPLRLRQPTLRIQPILRRPPSPSLVRRLCPAWTSRPERRTRGRSARGRSRRRIRCRASSGDDASWDASRSRSCLQVRERRRGSWGGRGRRTS